MKLFEQNINMWSSYLQKREAFCQLLQLMKKTYSQQNEPDAISVFVGTWNMGKAVNLLFEIML